MTMRGAWYRVAEASFWPQLADTTILSGESMSPRQAMVRTVDQNFKAIAQQLHANTVFVDLPDDDGFHGQYGGGFSYDPHARPTPQHAVGLEIILSIAAKYGLKVVPVISPSDFHVLVDPTWGSSAGPAPMDAPGMWGFLHSLFDPPLYYGEIHTTDLEIAGLQNAQVNNYFGDQRIAGWVFSGELNSNIPETKLFVQNWWWFFDLLVHWNGSQAFTSTYMINTLADRDWSKRVPAFLALFSGQKLPNILGFEWYGYQGTGYNLADGPRDVAALVAQFKASAPGCKLAVIEGGSDMDILARPSFYDACARAAVNGSLALFNCWQSDSFGNVAPGMVADWGSQKVFSLFNGAFVQTGSRNYPLINPAGWHWRNGSKSPYADKSNWTLVTGAPMTSACGVVNYTDLTPVGQALANAYAKMQEGEDYQSWLG